MTLQWHGRFRGLGLRTWALSSRRNVHSLCHQFWFQPHWLFPTSGNGSISGGTNFDASGLVPCSTSQQRFLVQYWCCLLWVLHKHDGRVAGFWLAQGQQGPAPAPPSWSWIWRFQHCRVVFCGPPSVLFKRRKCRTDQLVRCLLRTFPRHVFESFGPFKILVAPPIVQSKLLLHKNASVLNLLFHTNFLICHKKCGLSLGIAFGIWILVVAKSFRYTS